jgi:hypothetical protein
MSEFGKSYHEVLGKQYIYDYIDYNSIKTYNISFYKDFFRTHYLLTAFTACLKLIFATIRTKINYRELFSPLVTSKQRRSYNC